MKRFPLVFVLVLVLVLGMIGVAQAITNGQPDGEGHPYVGLVTDGVSAVCSGSSISDKVFVTAAHCFQNLEPGGTVFVTFDPEGLFSRSLKFYTGKWYPDPEFCQGCGNGSIPGFHTHDVAVVVFDKKVKRPSYASLPEENLVEGLSNGTQVTIVGYGVQEFEPSPGGPPQPGDRDQFTRYVAESNLVPSENSISDEFIKLSQNPGQDKGGFCFGDSGGPDLLGNTILAVNSFVLDGPKCDGVGYSYRIDTKEALDFIKQFIK